MLLPMLPSLRDCLHTAIQPAIPPTPPSTRTPHLSCSACSMARCFCSRSCALLARLSTLRVAARPLRGGDAPCSHRDVDEQRS